jgi:hypothetical protein
VRERVLTWLIGGDVRGLFLASKRRGEKVLLGRQEERKMVLPSRLKGTQE